MRTPTGQTSEIPSVGGKGIFNLISGHFPIVSVHILAFFQLIAVVLGIASGKRLLAL